MNKFGDFLYELRKERGMTQSALAERLGVTNKAVSKWETGEAMPETSLLLPLSEIFGVTVDELLNGRRCGKDGQPDGNINEREGENGEDESGFDPVGHLFTRGKDDEPETFLDKLRGAICAAVILCSVAVYLFLGGFAGLWHPYWVVIPVCALSCGIIGIAFEMCDGEKRSKQRQEGKNPYTGGVCGIIVLASVIVYLLLGTLAGLWHPYWIVVIVGVAVGGSVATIGNCVSYKRKNK